MDQNTEAEMPPIALARRLKHDASGRSRLGACLGATLLLGFWTAPAHAVPAFAAQTGRPCEACHVGGFGPQLTPYGRTFKLNGYTQRSTAFSLPFSAMAVASYVRTAKAQPEPPAAHFNTNDNFGLDQISVFLAGGFGSHFGAFVQATYDGIAHAFTWDNLDLRAVTHLAIKGADILLGVSANNNPGVQDPWNTLPAWGFPYTSSALAPSPGAATLLDGALAQTSMGATAYAWINQTYYVEAGAYGSPGTNALGRLGADPFSPGDIQGLAPYGRIAMQRPLGGGTFEVGGVALHADLHPGRDRTTGLLDHYTDLGLDASWQRALARGDTISVNTRWLHESQNLEASCSLAGAPVDGCAHNDLTSAQLDTSYYWKNKVGLTLGVMNLAGSANPVINAANRNFSPNSTGLLVQLDGTPFGGRPQPARRLNLRVGLQYSHFGRFDGARHDFDTTGRNAADNDTVRVFTWFAF
jgi:hypothetical protein